MKVADMYTEYKTDYSLNVTTVILLQGIFDGHTRSKEPQPVVIYSAAPLGSMESFSLC